MEFQLLQIANITLFDFEQDIQSILNLKLDNETLSQVQQLYKKFYIYAHYMKQIYKKICKSNGTMFDLNLDVPVLPLWQDVQEELINYITPRNKNLILLNQIDFKIKKFDLFLWSVLVKLNVIQEGFFLCMSMFIQGLYNITLLYRIMEMFKFNEKRKEQFIYCNLLKCNKELFTCVEEKNVKILNINILLKTLKTCRALQQHVYFNLTYRYKCCSNLKLKYRNNICEVKECNNQCACRIRNNAFYKVYSFLFNKRIILYFYFFFSNFVTLSSTCKFSHKTLNTSRSLYCTRHF
ncbi:hypothetical protein [Parapoynx stagnalis nucleopolyhedrovirus]|uniref:Transmembrane protein n=1 Tax=Parapoynx stagnalis nucleopolyhedrovirus TaxID=2993413 RepID=A0A9E7YDP0_9ABAC|nr:hypothetical protein [Parapoynx stagnalis nucleopolyhedrovirus]